MPSQSGTCSKSLVNIPRFAEAKREVVLPLKEQLSEWQKPGSL
jgi:hypothetical protein